MKRSVVYYSLSGNTKETAEYLAAELGADLYGIEPVKPMPDSFKKQILVGGMQSSFGLTPKIKNVPANLTDYDEIVVGTPIWAGKIAAPVNTLLKKYQIADKVVAVFVYSGSGNSEKCFVSLEKTLKNLKAKVSLVDRSSQAAADNQKKVIKFVEMIRR